MRPLPHLPRHAAARGLALPWRAGARPAGACGARPGPGPAESCSSRAGRHRPSRHGRLLQHPALGLHLLHQFGDDAVLALHRLLERRLQGAGGA